jgi:negative regulator of flagellin synthesis FlgM
MKIGNPAEKPASAAAATAQPAATEAAKAHSAATPATPDASAKLQLSSTASSLLSSGSAEFDSDKVAKISKSIEDGTYKVNHEAIADKLIANAQEVLTKAQH